MNRYEQYQWDKYGPPEEAQEKTRRGLIDWAGLKKMRGILGIPVEKKSGAVQYAEANAEELDEVIQNAMYIKLPARQFGHSELTWNTPFGPVLCRRSRSPEALYGWVFVDA